MPEDKNFITMLGTGNALATRYAITMLRHPFHEGTPVRLHGLAARRSAVWKESCCKCTPWIRSSLATTWLWAAWRMQSPY